jgi:hypothetical protein
MNCSEVSKFFKLEDSFRPTHYSGIYTSPIRIIPRFVHDFMTYTTAEEKSIPCLENSDCNSTQICLAHQCIFSNHTYIHKVLSPGIQYDSNSNSYIIQNGSEPLWTESRWETIYMQLYLQDSSSVQWVLFIGGLGFVISSFLIVYYVKSYIGKRLKLD